MGFFKVGRCFNNFNVWQALLAAAFFVGIFLRTKAYFSGYTLWLDECSLSLSIIKKGIFGYFAPLEHTQSAPPLFMMLTKFVTFIFGGVFTAGAGVFSSVFGEAGRMGGVLGRGVGINEFSLRLVPFISSIASIPLFYFVSKKFLEKKFSRFAALLLFCVNYPLIYYSVEFKQYSSDVFLCLLFILMFLSLDVKNLGIRKMFLLGLFSFLGALFSLPVCFVAGAFVVQGLWLYRGFGGEFKNVFLKISAFLLPFFVLMPFYYLFVLYPSKIQMMSGYYSLWQSGFLTLNPLSFVLLLKENLSYFFSQSDFVLFGVLLLLTGFIRILRNAQFIPCGSENKDENVSRPALFLTIFLLIVILASFFKIYPIKERVALYLLPYLIILIVKPLDMLALRGWLNKIALVLFLIFVSAYNFQYFKNIYPEIAAKKGVGDEFMTVLKSEYKNGEIVVYNDASDPVYQYNSLRQGLFTDNIIAIRLVEYSKDFYLNLLDELPKGYTYWLYYPYDYAKRPVIPFLKEWAKDKSVIKMIESTNACLLYVKL